MKLFKKREYTFDFIKQSKFAYVLSVVLVTVSLFSLFTRGLNYGIDFEGGIQIEATSTEPIKMEQVRESLGFLKGLTIQSVGLEGKTILIEAQPTETENSNALLEKIKMTLGETFTYNNVEIIYRNNITITNGQYIFELTTEEKNQLYSLAAGETNPDFKFVVKSYYDSVLVGADSGKAVLIEFPTKAWVKINGVWKRALVWGRPTINEPWRQSLPWVDVEKNKNWKRI